MMWEEYIIYIISQFGLEVTNERFLPFGPGVVDLVDHPVQVNLTNLGLL